MNSGTGAPPALPPLEGAARLLGTLALALAIFMNVLDTSIANVSIPAISGDLGVSPDQGTWVITSFGVANAISVPLTGWLTRRFGQVRLFTLSIFLFVIASFLCGLAPSIGMLIILKLSTISCSSTGFNSLLSKSGSFSCLHPSLHLVST